MADFEEEGVWIVDLCFEDKGDVVEEVKDMDGEAIGADRLPNNVGRSGVMILEPV